MQESSRRADTHRAHSEHDAQRGDALRLVRSHEGTLQRLVDAYEASAIDLAELTTRSERVRARMARAQDELAALEKVLAEKRELQLVISRVEDFAQRLRKGVCRRPPWTAIPTASSGSGSDPTIAGGGTHPVAPPSVPPQPSHLTS